jgi:four helix bundle protein
MPDDKPGTVRNFEDFNVYRQARSLTNEIFRLTRVGSFAKDFGLVDQIRRAAVSILSNIAEGYERGSNTEFIQFLYIAKGSCGEVRAQLSIAHDQGYVPDADHQRLANHCRLTSSMLSNFIDHLKGSRYPGQKFKPPERNWAAEAVDKQLRVLSELAATRKKAEQEKAQGSSGETSKPEDSETLKP